MSHISDAAWIWAAKGAGAVDFLTEDEKREAVGYGRGVAAGE